MKLNALFVFAVFAIESQAAQIDLKLDFSKDSQWAAGFSDYSPNQPIAEQFGIRPLPKEIGEERSGYFLSGNNASDDLFMFVKRKLGASEGILPNTSYRLERVTIRLASNAPSGCTGSGGPPGEGVTIKFGLTKTEPQSVIVQESGTDIWRMNIDKGNQVTGGSDVILLGNIANGLLCDELVHRPYISVNRKNQDSMQVQSDVNGELWISLGTDSGHEGITSLYYQTIDIVLVPIN